MLLRLAKERGIGSSTIDLREYLKDEEFVDFDDESFDEPPEPPNLLHKMQAFALRCHEFQLNSPPGLTLVYDSATKSAPILVSLMTNYEVGTGRLNITGAIGTNSSTSSNLKGNRSGTSTIGLGGNDLSCE